MGKETSIIKYIIKRLLVLIPVLIGVSLVIKAIPMPDLLPEHQLQNSLRGEVSNPISPPPGCRFAPRCNYCTERCAAETPPFEFVDGTDHKVACWLYSKN